MRQVRNEVRPALADEGNGKPLLTNSFGNDQQVQRTACPRVEVKPEAISIPVIRRPKGDHRPGKDQDAV